jgi:hypothetical protein
LRSTPNGYESGVKILGRWRGGSTIRGRAFLPAGTPTLKAPSYETAEELVDVFRKHGLVATITRPQGRKVELEKGDGYRRDEVIRAVEMWLLLDSSPDRITLRCGPWRRVVRARSELIDQSRNPSNSANRSPS